MAGNSAATDATLSSRAAIFKEKYIPATLTAINTGTEFMTAVPKRYDLVGSNLKGHAKLSIGKGSAANVIPHGTEPERQNLTVSPYPYWITAQIDLEAEAASSNDEGAWIRTTRAEVEECVTWWNYSNEYIFLNDATGKIGTVDFSAGLTAGTDSDTGLATYTFTVTDDSWFEPIYEIGAQVNFGSDREPFVIQNVDWDDKQLVVSRHPDYSHSYVPSTAITADTDFYLNRVPDANFLGMYDVASAVDDGSATLYGIRVKPKWASHKLNAQNSPLAPEMIVELANKTYDRTGYKLDTAYLSVDNHTVLEQQLGSKIEYSTMKPADNKYIDYGIETISIRCKYGRIKLVPCRMMRRDSVYLTMQDPRVQSLCFRPGHGWQTKIDNGGQFLRDFSIGSIPKARALFGGYQQLWQHPGLMGYIYNLQTVSNVT